MLKRTQINTALLKIFTYTILSLMSIAGWPIAAGEPSTPTNTDDNFNLARVIDTVMKNSFEIIRSIEEKNATKAGIDQALSAYYPQLDVSAAYQHFTYIPTLTLGTVSLPFGTANAYDAHVGLQMKIYDFGKTSSTVASSREKNEIAEDNTLLTRQKLSFQAIQIFYAILLLQKSIAVQDTELADLEQNRKLMQSRVRAGAAIHYDVVNGDVRIALSKSRRIDLVNALATQKIQLNRLLGRDEKKLLNVIGELNYDKENPDEDSLIGRGSEKRLEIHIARRQQNLAEQELTHAQRLMLPDLYAGGTAGYKNGYPLDFNQMHGNANIGVAIQAPIFSGFHDMAKIEEQNARLKAASANYADVKIAVRADILQAIKNLSSSEEKIAAADAQVEQARDAAKRSQALYKVGTITSREMLDARTTLLQVEIMKLQSLYSYILASYNLKRAAGDQLWSAVGR